MQPEQEHWRSILAKSASLAITVLRLTRDLFRRLILCLSSASLSSQLIPESQLGKKKNKKLKNATPSLSASLSLSILNPCSLGPCGHANINGMFTRRKFSAAVYLRASWDIFVCSRRAGFASESAAISSARHLLYALKASRDLFEIVRVLFHLVFFWAPLHSSLLLENFWRLGYFQVFLRTARLKRTRTVCPSSLSKTPDWDCVYKTGS